MDLLQALIGGQAPVLNLDTGIILFVFIAGFLYGLRARKKRLILFIVSFYGSIALLYLFPFTQAIAEKFPTAGQQGISLGLLLIFLFAFYYVLSGSAFKLYLPIPKWKREQFWHIAILSVTASGLIISTALSTFPNLFKVGISQVTESLFLTDTARLIWLLAPLVAIRLVAKYMPSRR